MLSAVEIDPGYMVQGAMHGYDDVSLVGYDDVSLVGARGLGLVEVEPGYGVMGYDDVSLVGALGMSDGTKKWLTYGAIAIGVLGVGVGGYFLLR